MFFRNTYINKLFAGTLPIVFRKSYYRRCSRSNCNYIRPLFNQV